MKHYNIFKESILIKEKRKLLSNLWLFTILNYLYCDIVTLMDSNLLKQFLIGNVGNMDITQSFLLGASLLMEIPIIMVLFSRILVHKINKSINIIAGIIMTLVQISTLISPATYYYIFFSIIEIISTILIVLIAINWNKEESID